MGSETNTLTVNNLPSHSHGYFRTSDSTGSTALTINQIPSHYHDFYNTGRNLMWDSGLPGMGGLTSGTTVQYTWNCKTSNSGGSQGHTHSITNTWASTGSTGGSEVVNNVQPSKVCIRWHRIS